MLGLVMSLVAAVAPALPAADVAAACAEGPASCDLAPVDLAPRVEERTYATPAVIDCRSPVVPLVLSTLVGECTGTPHDASYRASRYPESEDSQSVAPANGERRSGVVACDGLPQNAPGLPLSDAQPLAVFATPAVVHAPARARAPSDTLLLPSRFGDPPDRPPRV
ncbi:MAG TPA: hypothetical protein VGK52_06840 [Polyangia bacterium]|jgi:hypothetical protein